METVEEIVVKTCTRCGKTKPIEDFKTRKDLKSGKAAECKKCNYERQLEWQEKNKDKRSDYMSKYHESYIHPDPDKRKKQWKKYKLKNKYNLTVEELEQMLKDQDYKCAICGCDFIDDTTHRMGRYNVDHDHKTGKVRGLLCTDHNLILGKINDNVDILQSMIDYLNHHKSNQP